MDKEDTEWFRWFMNIFGLVDLALAVWIFASQGWQFLMPLPWDGVFTMAWIGVGLLIVGRFRSPVSGLLAYSGVALLFMLYGALVGRPGPWWGWLIVGISLLFLVPVWVLARRQQ